MGEWLIVATFITGAILAIRTVGGRSLVSVEQRPHPVDVDDLPCPWCHASTSEQDARCPGCGRRFG